MAPNAIDDTAILGLSLSLPYALIHTVLGLTSLSHGLRARVATSRVAVATPARARVARYYGLRFVTADEDVRLTR